MDKKIRERRKQERTPANKDIINAVIRPVDEKKEIWCMVVDVSGRGIQISTPLRIIPGTEVAISITFQEEKDALPVTRHQDYTGLVRWCNQDTVMSETYNIGIEFLPLGTAT